MPTPTKVRFQFSLRAAFLSMLAFGPTVPFFRDAAFRVMYRQPDEVVQII